MQYLLSSPAGKEGVGGQMGAGGKEGDRYGNVRIKGIDLARKGLSDGVWVQIH